VAICWETADWVYDSVSAAAENEPARDLAEDAEPSHVQHKGLALLIAPITTIIRADGTNVPHCFLAIGVETESFNAKKKGR